MRFAFFAIISSTAVLLSCGTVPSVGGTETESGTDTDTSSSSGTTASNPTTSGSGGPSCFPGTTIPCTCKNGDKGAQACNAQGNAYLECECEGGSNSASEATTDAPGTSSETSSTSTSGVDTTTEPETSTTDPGTTDTDSGTSTTSGGVMCEDPGEEPNEDENSAIAGEEQGCNSGPDTLSGLLAGPTDVDWFTWHGSDGFMGCGFGGVEGDHELTASENIRLCVFVECDQGNEDIECGGDSTQNTSPDGRPGCCNQGNVTFSTLNCTMAGEDMQFYVRLDQAPADTCVDYEVEYDFNN